MSDSEDDFYSKQNYNYLINKIRLLKDNDIDKEEFLLNYKNFKLEKIILDIKGESTMMINKKYIEIYYNDLSKTLNDKMKNTQDFTVDDYRNLNLHTDDSIVYNIKANIPWRSKIGTSMIKSFERDIDDTLPNVINPETPVRRSFNHVRNREVQF